MVWCGLWVGVGRREDGENDLTVGDLGLHLPRDGETCLLKPIPRDADKRNAGNAAVVLPEAARDCETMGIHCVGGWIYLRVRLLPG